MHQSASVSSSDSVASSSKQKSGLPSPHMKTTATPTRSHRKKSNLPTPSSTSKSINDSILTSRPSLTGNLNTPKDSTSSEVAVVKTASSLPKLTPPRDKSIKRLSPKRTSSSCGVRSSSLPSNNTHVGIVGSVLSDEDATVTINNVIKRSNSIGRVSSMTRTSSSSSSVLSPKKSNGGGENEEAMKVCVRIRPLQQVDNDTSSEQQRSWIIGDSENSVIRNNSNTLTDVIDGIDNSFAITPTKTKTTEQSYNFDKVYGEEASTQDVYEDIVKEIVSSVCHQGRNGTVFSYGQTSTGKTYTMHGIICSAARDIFQNVEDREESGKKESQSLTIVKVACMELYNEELRDLLVNNGNSSSSPALSIKEDRKGNVQIPYLTEQRVSSVDDLLTVIHAADMNRSVGATAMNQRSSRSHTIFRITYEKKEAKATHACSAGKVDDGEGDVECTLDGVQEDKENSGGGSQKSNKKVVTTVSTLNLVDLAGSESVRLTNASGVRQKEGGKINQSLLTLSTVLVKLGKKDSGHINYRDSKLTRILKPSLSGNARMSAICCISPACQYSEESKSTLDFASRAMLVRTNAKTNETIEYDDALVGEFEKEIERFKAETANAEESKRKLAVSLQEAEEQIVCLMANMEIEKSRSITLEKQNYEYMMQVEELTLRNEELKEMKKQDSAESSESNEKLLKTINDLTVQNEELQKKMKVVSEEKAQLEWRLMREQKKAQRRKEEALEKRRTFKSKLTSMTGRLKEDMKHVELSSQAN